jgi:HEAT repeat protein
MFERLTQRRIRRLVSRLCDPNQKLAEKAEVRLLRFGHLAIKPLLELVHHRSPHVRYRVVWVLGKTKDSRAFEAILKLAEDRDHRVAYDAMLALAELGDERAVPHLFRLFKRYHNDSQALDDAAIMALKRLGAVGVDDL